MELAAIIVLALATIGTAWSGYQATRWSGVQAADYVTANFLRVESTKAASRAGQDRLYDSQVFSQWLNAYAVGNHDLASIYQRRFRPEFVIAFEAWMAAESFTEPSAPPGPLSMSEYRSQQEAASERLEAEAVATFDRGSRANEVADAYVLNTVFLASALFLAGIASRFSWSVARVATLAIALVTLVIGLLSILASAGRLRTGAFRPSPACHWDRTRFPGPS